MQHDKTSYQTAQLARDVYEYSLRIYTMRCNGLDSSFLESMLNENLAELVKLTLTKDSNDDRS